MSVATAVTNVSKKMSVKTLLKLTHVAVRNRRARKFLLKQMEKRMFEDLIKANPYNRPVKVQEDKYYMGRALLRRIDKVLTEGHLSRKATEGLLSVFLGNVFFGGFYKRAEFVKKHGFKPPVFLTISPGKACNLRCKGCYADSGKDFREKLDYDIFSKIINDAKNLWGSSFFVISGGEPLLYQSKGKSILDIYGENSDCYFLMYTNGTLINKKMAQKLADLGNVTPAISVEGFKKETDERRGKGVFEMILAAMENLRESGVPFGISFTVLRDNLNIPLSEEFFDFYFEKQKAIYAWMFQYMPIGRGYTLDLMPTPEQRLELFKKEWSLVRERDIFIADFWNSAASSDGCISAGRGGGYFYIEWNGNITPCVFVPYTTHNIYDIYKKGGNLNVALHSKFFCEIRKWQAEYGYEKPPEEHQNWIMPCLIRDHHKNFREVVQNCGAKGIDEPSNLALEDEDYHKGLIKYDEEFSNLTEEIWQKHYLQKSD
ncbi:radical SAM protein [candidate division WOR-3 bacterium]|nr:radical SAM protein [candidate division WOR-3 bacterium]